MEKRKFATKNVCFKEGVSSGTFPAKSEIQRVFPILPNGMKKIKKINHLECDKNIDFTY